MSETDIFLSYARHDRAVARMFADGLADEGFSVWWDASLHSGETFDEVIEEKLRDAGAVVVLWSPRSVASRWVRAEATLADRRKKLAPAIIEPCDRPIIFELTHAADLCDWTGETSDGHWRAFVDDLRRLIEARAKDDKHAPPAPSHRSAANERRDSSQARPASRQPLRPGSDEVIVANRFDRGRQGSGLERHPVAGPAAVPSEIHCLEIEEGEVAAQTIVVDTAGIRIGRTAPADVVLAHKSISREHCIVGLANDELLVSDLNSTNGTYIDDTRITRATILPVGSVLRVGEISLRHGIYASDEVDRRNMSHLAGDASRQGGRLAATS